ncbi:radical SAM protein [Methanobrevibacter sp.]|uniref:radical SAM protein n=1 Tax=Methanobrevibacter sp. TaxID=66852 RepID=UPI0038905247
MHYTGPVYRHPLEANTPILEITYGCSWNKCTFCNMYRDVKFGASPMEHIEEDLQELASIYPHNLRKITVANGDPFALSTKKLLEISDMIRKYFPEISVISCQTSIRNIMHKKPEELDQLYEAMYDDIYVGIESGCDDVLKLLNKGYTSAQEYETLEKLKNSKIRYIALLMGGAGGKQFRQAHVEDTAKLLNTYPPKMISIITTGIPSGTRLAEMRDNGEFVQLTEREIIEDEMALIDALDVPNSVYFFGHHQNNVARVSGHMKDKEKLIDGFKQKIKELEISNPEILDSALSREYL